MGCSILISEKRSLSKCCCRSDLRPCWSDSQSYIWRFGRYIHPISGQVCNVNNLYGHIEYSDKWFTLERLVSDEISGRADSDKFPMICVVGIIVELLSEYGFLVLIRILLETLTDFRPNDSDEHFHHNFVGICVFRQNTDGFGRRYRSVFL